MSNNKPMTARELAHVGGRPWCNDATGKHAPECDERTAAIERDRAGRAGTGATRPGEEMSIDCPRGHAGAGDACGRAGADRFVCIPRLDAVRTRYGARDGETAFPWLRRLRDHIFTNCDHDTESHGMNLVCARCTADFALSEIAVARTCDETGKPAPSPPPKETAE